MTETDAVKECRDILAAQTGPRDMEYLVQTLLKRHAKIKGRDKDFALLAEYVAAQRWFKQARRRRPSASDEDEGEEKSKAYGQMILPGYEYLQESYAVTRDGRQQDVPIEAMTEEEIQIKAHEYRRMAKGNNQHAEELDRYLAERRAR